MSDVLIYAIGISSTAIGLSPLATGVCRRIPEVQLYEGMKALCLWIKLDKFAYDGTAAYSADRVLIVTRAIGASTLQTAMQHL